MSAATTIRVKIPRTPAAPTNPLDGVPAPLPSARPEDPTSDVPGTFITAMPPLPEPEMKELEVTSVNPPYSYARISYSDRRKEYIYEVIEPQLSRHERELVAHLKSTLSKILGSEVANLTHAAKRTYLRGEVEAYLKTRQITLSPLSTERVIYYIQRDFVGYGPVDALILDPRVEDISCDGVDVPLFVFHGKYESVKTNVIFEDEDALNSFIVALGQRCGKSVSVSSPILDGTTPEGHRVQATYAREITTRGASFTIRRFKEKPFTPVDLILTGSASEEMIAYFWLAAEQGESLIICGGPAAGKTSTLNAIALFIPPTSKIVSIEDTREVNLPHENWIPGATRSGTGDRGPDGKAAGEVDMFDLVRAALRQRPNYIIVGEVRGKETYTMFQAMATGHTTYSTMHADSVKSMVNRLENPPINTPRILLSALNNVIIQIQARTDKGVVRRLKQVLEIVGFEPETNELITNTVYEWDPGTDKFVFKGHSFLFDKIMEIRNYTHDEMDAEFQRRVAVIHYLCENKINDHRQLWRLVAGYYKDPTEVMARVQGTPPAAETPGVTRADGGIEMAVADATTPLDAGEGHRLVRVKKGAQPTHSQLSGLQRWTWRTFRERVAKLPPDPVLDDNLLKAHMRVRSDEYLAFVYGVTLIVGVALVVAGIVLGILIAVSGDLLLGAVIGPIVPVLGTFMTFFILRGTPSSTAKSRGKKIDSKISPAMSFVSAMASADVNVDQIFKELARQKVYGEAAEEAAWITRDTELLGVDILTAIRTGAGRTPSKRFQDFLQGVVTTATSGGQLKPYFLVKAEQYERENKLDRQKRVETMGLMAETFVTVVVAFPLFLVIIIAIFAIIGGGGAFMLNVLWGIVLGMIPLSQFAFVFFMYQLAQEL